MSECVFGYIFQIGFIWHRCRLIRFEWMSTSGSAHLFLMKTSVYWFFVHFSSKRKKNRVQKVQTNRAIEFIIIQFCVILLLLLFGAVCVCLCVFKPVTRFLLEKYVFRRGFSLWLFTWIWNNTHGLFIISSARLKKPSSVSVNVSVFDTKQKSNLLVASQVLFFSSFLYT